jgi:hypothetical protein
VILKCASWSKTTRAFGGVGAVRSFGRQTLNKRGESACEATTQPVVAIRGREASVVDALGLICNEP